MTARLAELYPGLPTLLTSADLDPARAALLIDRQPAETLRRLYAPFTLRPLATRGSFTAYRLEPQAAQRRALTAAIAPPSRAHYYFRYRMR